VGFQGEGVASDAGVKCSIVGASWRTDLRGALLPLLSMMSFMIGEIGSKDGQALTSARLRQSK
jgi:hypothetical protein